MGPFFVVFPFFVYWLKLENFRMNTVSTNAIDLKCKNGTLGMFGRGLWIFERSQM